MTIFFLCAIIFTLDFMDGPLLVFKLTENKVPLGHVTDTQCRPDYTAAFDKHWGKDGIMFWPCIRLAGEKASKGKSKEDQTKQAISYLHYLLLARPDLHVAQRLLTTETSITFLLGIGGLGLRSFEVPWGMEVYEVAYAFFYRLYDPGDFADRGYELMDSSVMQYLDLDPKKIKDVVVPYNMHLEVTEMIEVDGVEGKTTSPAVCVDFIPICTRNPFETRTHVLSNPSSELTIHGKPLTVLKDQMCRLGTRFNEHTILNAVHKPGEVPGVVEMLYQKIIKSSHLLGNERGKHLTGLRQSGMPFLSLPNLQQVLETIFDVLEGPSFHQTFHVLCSHCAVLRFLRYKCQILHRDISKGNVLYVEEETFSTTDAVLDAGSVGAGGINVTEELCLYLLCEGHVQLRSY